MGEHISSSLDTFAPLTRPTSTFTLFDLIVGVLNLVNHVQLCSIESFQIRSSRFMKQTHNERQIHIPDVTIC